MKLHLKLLLFTLVLALAAPFILKDEDGRPLMEAGKLRMPTLGTPSLPALDAVRNVVDEAGNRLTEWGGEPPATTVYKWRDAAGGWHFSDEAPPGVNSQRVVIGGDGAPP